ncbi:hypothetical protein ATN84_21155 [Paramesorhizobium deserti]|uniref:Uncharacterized protein n=1 Tax=Paramesorhizobium deserti TaxID=1494590 RepID=A0A135HPS3_9HYPH|nr:hypothetical protein [Paramesorhizobium deserti]KXF75176.1 hypothetical protein ATN84_21155 [Paramesorhizobium deserti]
MATNTKYDNTVLMVNKSKAVIGIDKDPNFDDMRLVFDGVVWPDPSTGPYMLEPGKQVHVGAGYPPDYLAYATDMGVGINDARFLEIAVGPSDVTDSKVWTVVSDSGDDGSGLTYDVEDQTALSMTMIWHGE